MENTKTGVELIAEERQKQIDKHGFTAQYHVEHPEYYEQNQLNQASASLILFDVIPDDLFLEVPENWDKDWFYKLLNHSQFERLVIAGALIAAELDRLNLKEN